jgi:hypothetical protein
MTTNREATDSKKLKKGECVCIVKGSSEAIDRWVKILNEKANAEVNWHRSNGHAYIMHIGDKASRERTMKAINSLKNNNFGVVITCLYCL